MNLLNLNCRMDYVKFINVLAQYSHLVGALVYVGLPKKIPKEKKKFLSYLKKAGFIIQPRPIQETPNGKKKQKGVDVFMYKEIVELAEEDSYDRAIIVSGDADFVDAVKKLKELGKEFTIWSFKVSLAQALIDEAGKENVQYIDSILEYIALPEN
ncbi:MAG: NYN domain-containing protein [Candidatus Hermodarchaeota archaeon]